MQVKLLTAVKANGCPSVTVDIVDNSSKSELKRKLETATGVPFKHQKILLAGIDQLCMADKR